MSNEIAQGLEACTTLRNGVKMPWLGLGTWRASNDEAGQATTEALELGYRHIDTAAIYKNEEGVGRAVAKFVSGGKLGRQDVFVTTKIWNDDVRRGAQATQKALDASLERLGFDRVDLVLLHWPVGEYVQAWRGLETAYEQGKARAIGVSNFMVEHLEKLLSHAQVTPMVNQVEFHPYLVQPRLLGFCRDHRIQHEAWAPLMKGRVGEVEEIQRIADVHNKTAAQVVLRWHLQHGTITIPKSVHRERIAENAQVFDFELAEAEMQSIDALDRNERIGADPFDVTF